MHFQSQKNGQGTILAMGKGQGAFWAAEKQAECCTLLKMLMENTTYMDKRKLKGTNFQILAKYFLKFHQTCFSLYIDFVPNAINK